jgi:hypothetical protein
MDKHLPPFQYFFSEPPQIQSQAQILASEAAPRFTWLGIGSWRFGLGLYHLQGQHIPTKKAPAFEAYS